MKDDFLEIIVWDIFAENDDDKEELSAFNPFEYDSIDTLDPTEDRPPTANSDRGYKDFFENNTHKNEDHPNLNLDSFASPSFLQNASPPNGSLDSSRKKPTRKRKAKDPKSIHQKLIREIPPKHVCLESILQMKKEESNECTQSLICLVERNILAEIKRVLGYRDFGIKLKEETTIGIFSLLPSLFFF